MLFFLSGIFFDISRLPESIQGYLWLNPMAVMINMYRQVLHNSVLPDLLHLVLIILFSAVTMAFAMLLYYRFDRIYPKIIH
jgi:lipopolysaccharide transport system permease protein